MYLIFPFYSSKRRITKCYVMHSLRKKFRYGNLYARGLLDYHSWGSKERRVKQRQVLNWDTVTVTSVESMESSGVRRPCRVIANSGKGLGFSLHLARYSGGKGRILGEMSLFHWLQILEKGSVLETGHLPTFPETRGMKSWRWDIVLKNLSILQTVVKYEFNFIYIAHIFSG